LRAFISSSKRGYNSKQVFSSKEFCFLKLSFVFGSTDRKEIADILCEIKQERLLMKNGNRLVCKLVIIGLHYHIFQCFLDAEHFALLQKEKMDHLLSGF